MTSWEQAIMLTRLADPVFAVGFYIATHSCRRCVAECHKGPTISFPEIRGTRQAPLRPIQTAGLASRDSRGGVGALGVRVMVPSCARAAFIVVGFLHWGRAGKTGCARPRCRAVVQSPAPRPALGISRGKTARTVDPTREVIFSPTIYGKGCRPN